MGTRVIKTAGQVAFEDFHSLHPSPLPWIGSSLKAQWEAFAAKHNIQPLTEEVAEKPTDGELLVKAYDTSCDGGNDAIAAEFLRLRAERDGTNEPLPVTEELLDDWHTEWRTNTSPEPWSSWVAPRINQHRGVRPVPQVTAEMLEQALRRETLVGAAESLNAELAKGATTATVQPMKVAAYVLSNGVLHTFEDEADALAFARSHEWGSAVRDIDGVEHHPRKDGGK